MASQVTLPDSPPESSVSASGKNSAQRNDSQSLGKVTSKSKRSVSSIQSVAILEAELETAVQVQRLEDEKAERQRKVLDLQLKLKKAKIVGDSGSSITSAAKSSSWHSRPVAPVLNPLAPEFQPALEEADKETATASWVATQQMPQTHQSLVSAAELTEAIREAIAAAGHSSADVSRKFMARMTVGHKLPEFDGKPEDWPVFISLFTTSTKECGLSDIENLVRLQKALRGKALGAVKSLMTTPQNVPEILRTLELRFGRAEQIISTLVSKAKSCAPVKPGDFDGLIEFYTAVKTLVSTMELLKQSGHLMNPQLRQELVKKLPPALQLSWGEVIRSRGATDISLQAFCNWLSQKAEAAALVSNEVESSKPKSTHRHDRVLAMQDSKLEPQSKCEFCERVDHAISACPKFKAESVNARLTWTKQKQRCFSCLEPGHLSRNCTQRSECGKNGCKYPHHPLLHRDAKATEQKTTTKEKPQQKEQAAEHSLTAAEVSGAVLLKVTPVVLEGPNGSILTTALFDEGSTVSLIDASLAEEIGAYGPQDPLRLKWTGDIAQQDLSSQRVQIRIRGAKCSEMFELNNARTMRNLSLPLPASCDDKARQKWSHLEGIDLPIIPMQPPQVLIGQDNVHLTVAREIAEGSPDAPMASRTKLGWILHGKVSCSRSKDTLLHITDSGHDALHQLVRDSFSVENFGVRVTESLKPEAVVRAEKLLEQTTQRVGGRFETGLLWKEDSPSLPSSYSMALNRLRSLERKLDRDPALAVQYGHKINEYLEKGYARKLTDTEVLETGPTTWFLPHFGVVNINKPGKLRFVFDAAAKVNGVSLNDALLPGPDLLNQLIGVIMRFRQYGVAFGGDVKEMFHQVNIRPADQQAQRFLWRGVRRDGPPDQYVMQVMIFGAVSSPASAQYAMRKNAAEFTGSFPEATAAIHENYYMDDYYDSCSTEVAAISRVADSIEVQKRGGFKVCGWVSNSHSVLQSIPADLRAADDVTFDTNAELPMDRALGLKWNPNSDCFQFAVHPSRAAQLSDESLPLTKRTVLSHVMSVFDPLGFLAAFTIRARMLLQEIWLSGIGWDDELPTCLLKQWRSWCQQLFTIDKFSLPRCYSLKIPMANSVVLHVFCDASSKAFAAAAYVRAEDADGVETSLVAAKIRVAPLKPTSIPRLELQAAVLGCRLATMLKQEHRISFQQTVFWSDSRTVLSWINSDARQYKQFVAHRVGEICDDSSPKDWRWVPTNLNVADDATRGLEMDELCSGRWRFGPEFLRQPEMEWPVGPKLQEEVEPTDIKKEFLGTTAVATSPAILSEALPDPSRFSSVSRLIRATAYVLRAVSISPRKKSLQINYEEWQAAEELWWRRVQQEAFPDEVSDVSAGRPISASSRLRQLAPVMDSSGILRVGGRIDKAKDVPEETRHPVLLEPSHPFTRLLIRHHHVGAGHHGQALVLNELRQKYWILNARTAVRQSWTTCQQCKNDRSSPSVPIMAELPASRLTPDVRPFSSTGMDYFGPMNVRIGRRTEKRYGVLFTCMATRAIHLELAASLTTDSCILAIRRFISRRGQPRHIYSDNGTNLRGADAALRTAIASIDSDKMIATLTPKSIEWHFNPPAAPHMGGAWERLVRSVKTAMRVVLHEQAPAEETLHTVLLEAEALVNSRPLTYVSVDPADMEALTPNHFLLGSSSTTHPPGKFDQRDLCLRKSWRFAQVLADQFWRRWLREYLPELTRRTKWHTGHDQSSDLAIDDVVIIADGNLPRGSWPRGRVVAVHPGSDGRVRVAKVKTATGTYRRPVAKLCKLDLVS